MLSYELVWLTYLYREGSQVRWLSSTWKLVHEDLHWIQVLRFKTTKVSLDGMFKLRPSWRVARLLTHPVEHLDQTEAQWTVINTRKLTTANWECAK